MRKIKRPRCAAADWVFGRRRRDAHPDGRSAVQPYAVSVIRRLYSVGWALALLLAGVRDAVLLEMGLNCP